MAERTKAVVQWAVRTGGGLYDWFARTKQTDAHIRVRITEVPAKASKQKATKRKAKR